MIREGTDVVSRESLDSLVAELRRFISLQTGIIAFCFGLIALLGVAVVTQLRVTPSDVFGKVSQLDEKVTAAQKDISQAVQRVQAQVDVNTPKLDALGRELGEVKRAMCLEPLPAQGPAPSANSL